MESVSADQTTNAEGSRSHEEQHFELGVWIGFFDEAPSPKLNDRPPNGSTPGVRVSFFMTLAPQSFCTLNATKRGGCTSPEHRNLQIPPEMQHELHTHHRLGQEKSQYYTRDPHKTSLTNTFHHENCQFCCRSNAPYAQARRFRFFGFEGPSSIFGQSRAQ